MKYMIASDLHGSAYYCSKLFEAFDREAADKLILLGDLLYHGPRNDLPKEYAPKEVIAQLNEYKSKLLCVRGNCEAEVDQMVLEFPILADYMIWNLESRMVFVTHGHLYHEENLPHLQNGDILLHGHTHIPAIEEKAGYFYLNPGSVSMPKGGSQPSYLIYEDFCFSLKDLNGGLLKCKTFC